MIRFVSFILLALIQIGSTNATEKGPAIPDYTADKISPNSYVIHGPLGIPNPENQGFMNNPAFVITPAGVVVIDPGSSVQSGEMVLRQIRKVTTAPVVTVINTHMHGDHWLGNQAIADAYPKVKIYGHPNMIEAVNDGVGQIWVERMLNLTKGATAGTIVVAPDQAINDTQTITVGGIDFNIIHTGKAHTRNDLMIEVPSESVLFLGDNVLYKRLGQMNDGNFKGSIVAIDRALQSNAKVFVPGHGLTGGREVPQAYRGYLNTLFTKVSELYESGMSDYEMKPHVVTALKAYQNWVGFEGEIGRHTSLTYLEVEAESF